MAEHDRADMVAELVSRYAMADRYGAVSRVRQLLAAGVDDHLLAEVVGDAQRHVGALWQADAWTVSQEHAATAIAESVLATLDDHRPPAPARAQVAMVAADGEWHVLPARLAARDLEHAGVRVRFLGGSVPPEDLVRALPTAEVDAVAVSVTLSRHLPGAARSIAAAHAVGLPVVVGGQAVDAERAARLGADAVAVRPADAVDTVLAWATHGPPTPLARAELRPRPVARLREQRHELRSAALDGVRRRQPRPDPEPDEGRARIAEDLDVHLDHLEAAVLLDDPRVYGDGLAWIEAVLTARDRRGSLDLGLDALEEALADHEEARAMLHAAREAHRAHG
jgi:methanogenic corrinoid protein MtbC1